MENAEVLDLLNRAFELKRQEKYKHAIELLYKALSIDSENIDILMQIADIHWLLKNYSTALTLYEKLVSQHPENIDILAKIIDYYLELSENLKARTAIIKHVFYYPSQKAYEIYMKILLITQEFFEIIRVYKEKNLSSYKAINIDKAIGIAYLNTGDVDKAFGVFTNIEQNDEEDMELKYYLARCCYLTNQDILALAYVREVIEKEPNDKAYNLTGELMLDKKQYEKAIDLFDAATRLKPDALYFYNLASAFFMNGQMEEALKFYIKASSLAPNVCEYKYSQAYLFYVQQKYSKAIQIIDSILVINPSYDLAIALKIQIFINEGRITSAQSLLKNIEKNVDLKNPNKNFINEEFLKLRAKIYNDLTQLEMAKKDYLSLIELKSDNLEYKLELGKIYLSLNEIENAENIAKKIIEINSNYIDAYILLTNIYISLEKYNEAIEITDYVIKLDSNNYEVYRQRAIIHKEKEEYLQAMENAKIALGQSPSNAEIFAIIATCYMSNELNNYASAIEYFKEALNLSPNNQVYLLSIAEIYQRLNQEKEAQRYLYLAYHGNLQSYELMIKLYESYIKTKSYKPAVLLLRRYKKQSNSLVLKDELKLKIKETFSLYQQTNGIFKAFILKILKM